MPTRKVYSAVDAQPIVLYGKTAAANQNAIPILINSSGIIITVPGAPSAIANGKQTVAVSGSAVQLTTASTACVEVILTANSSNGGIIAFGGSGINAVSNGSITINGSYLFGSATQKIPIDDVSKIFIDASVSGNGVSFTYVT